MAGGGPPRNSPLALPPGTRNGPQNWTPTPPKLEGPVFCFISPGRELPGCQKNWQFKAKSDLPQPFLNVTSMKRKLELPISSGENFFEQWHNSRPNKQGHQANPKCHNSRPNKQRRLVCRCLFALILENRGARNGGPGPGQIMNGRQLAQNNT